MPSVLLTERGRGVRPDQLKANPDERVTYHDASLRGFGVRVSPDGTRSYFVWFRVGSRGKRTARLVTLGRVGEISLGAARAQAATILNDARHGRDVVAERQAAEKQAEKEARKAALVGETFEALAIRCLEDSQRELAPRTLAEYERTLKANVYPALGKLPPLEIERAHVRALVDEIARHAPIQANRTLAIISKVYGWALGKDILAVNPCLGLQKPGAENTRERVFSNDELRAIMAAVPGTEIADLVPLILYTATRSEEARSARWADMDLERRVWTIPDVKQGGSHVLPLSAGALRVLDRIPRAGAYVFPAGTKAGYIDHRQEIIKDVRERSGVSDFRLHDLRRTVRTRLSELGVSPDTGERILGHTLGRIRNVYDRHDFVPQMRSALEAWSGALDAILKGERKAAKIAAFRRG